jgi:ABC-type branched-subunit amino acid transport system ATPase component/branched-subunit amino acid ABC-type transport system permease component
MSIVLEFAIIGIATGGLISLLSVGIVVVYRGSRVVNFAQGALAMVGTYVFYSLHVTHQVNFVISLVVGVATSGVLGLGTHLLIMGPMRNSPMVSRIIASIAVLEVLEQGMSHIANPSPLFVPTSLPTSNLHFLGATVGVDQVIIVGIVAVMLVVLYVLYNHTQLGRATTAALDNPRALSALGFSVNRLGAINWVIGGCLAGLAGILLAPITGLAVSTYTLLVLPALAAAVMGRLNSVPLAVLGAVAIGIAQSEMSYYVSTPGWSDAAPFLLIVAILVVRGVGRIARTAQAQRLPRVGTGVIRARFVIPTAAVLLIITQVVNNQFWLGAITTSIGASIVLLSFVIVTGYSGQLSLAQFAFAGIGAWIAGRILISGVVPLPVSVILGVLLVFPVGLVLGAICLRTTGVNLAIATLGFAVSVEYLVFDSSTLTGPTGIVIGKLSLFGWNITSTQYPGRYAAVAVIAFFLAGIVTANARRGVVGQRLLAARANERAASSLGLRATQAKVFAFGLAAMIAALGGIVLGFANTTIVLQDFSTLPSLQSIAGAVIGGLGWVGGSAIGGFGQVGGVLQQGLGYWVGDTAANYVPLALAVLLVIVLRGQPDGGAPIMMGQLRPFARLLGVRSGSGATAPADLMGGIDRNEDKPVRAQEEIRAEPLEITDLTVKFGGVLAVDSASLIVRPGEVVGLIGPNGAGKTTVIDAITGYVQAGGGTVKLGDDVMDRLAPSARARKGLTRSFQSLELFDDLSVVDNLRAASDHGGLISYVSNVVWPRLPKLGSAARAAIPEFGLANSLTLLPPALPYSLRRLTAIARAVATNPSVLLLDEPAAGLDNRERRELSDLVQRLAHEWGMGVLLVEHDVGMVMRVCDRVYAMELGQIIAEGTPAEIRNDQRVVRAYLGSTAEPPDSTADAPPASAKS